MAVLINIAYHLCSCFCTDVVDTLAAKGIYCDIHGTETYPHRLDEVRAALWGMEVEEHHGQGLYAENGYVGKHLLPPCA
ncbi:MAG: hypothetical protein J5582_03935 [Ruminococcus sp.]|nr:hypothetical protein [Ruminococcus sp.]